MTTSAYLHLLSRSIADDLLRASWKNRGKWRVRMSSLRREAYFKVKLVQRIKLDIQDD